MADHEIYEDRIALEHVRRQLSTDSEDYPDEILDPRIQVELEKLNKASEDINKLELELDDARGSFRQALSESTQKLNALAKKLGACVEKARPYYDSRVKAKEIHMETQKVALRYERACSMHEAAKEMVQLAEQGYMHRGQTTDPAWQEMLNHATMKVNEAEKERNESESEHQKTTQLFKHAEDRVQFLQKDLKRAIAKSNLSTRRSFLQLSSIANQHWLECLPYFEMKIKFNQVMEDQKLQVGTLEEDVSSAKALYSQALHSLEAISDEIHQKRLERRKHLQLGIRSAGVGAEDPSPPPPWDSSRIDGSTTPRRYSCNNSNNALQSTVPSKDTSGNRKQSKSDVDSTDSDVFSGSLLFSSPERARSHSYRTAIETSQTALPVVSPVDSLCLADYDENFDVSSLEDDYMDLPKTHSPRGRVDPRVNRATNMKGSSHGDHSVSLTVQDKMYHKQIAAQKSCPPSQPIAITGHLSHVDVKHEIQSAPESSSLGSVSPSSLRKSPKLQGLILRVDPTMDPLQKTQSFKQSTHPYSNSKIPKSVPSRSGTNAPLSVVTGKPTSPNVSSSVGRIVAVSSAPVSSDPLNVSAVLGSSSQSSPAKPPKVIKAQSDASSKVKSMMTGANNIKDADNSSLSSPSYERRGLRIPPGTDMSQLSVEDSSDTESIASTGPMFDDDQIEFLSMDFSKQSIKDDLIETTEPIYKRQSWSRMSLPPRLNYLEGYLNRRTIDTTIQKQKDENSQVLEDISEQQSDNVLNDVQKKVESVNLEPELEASSIEDSTELKSVSNGNVEKTDPELLVLASSGDSNNDQEKSFSENVRVESLREDSLDKKPTSNIVQEKVECSTVSDSSDLKPDASNETNSEIIENFSVNALNRDTVDVESLSDDKTTVLNNETIIDKLPVVSVNTEQSSSHDG